MPKLEAFESVDVSGSWRAIRKYFVLNNSVTDMGLNPSPMTMGPMYLYPPNESTEDLSVFSEITLRADEAAGGATGYISSMAGSAVREYMHSYMDSTGGGGRFAGFNHLIQGLSDDAHVVATPLSAIGFPSATRKAAGVPLLAHSMRFFHPVADRPSEESLGELNHLESPGVAMVLNGAFGWYNLDDALIGVSEISIKPQVCHPQCDYHHCRRRHQHHHHP